MRSTLLALSGIIEVIEGLESRIRGLRKHSSRSAELTVVIAEVASNITEFNRRFKELTVLMTEKPDPWDTE